MTLLSPLAPDVRRATVAIAALALVSLALAGLYATFHHLGSGLALPDFGPSEREMTLGLLALSGLLLGWAALLLALGRAGTAEAVLGAARGAVSRERERPWAFWLAVVMAVAYAVARVALNEQTRFATIEEVVAGEARRPFSYRVLVPALVGLISRGPGLSHLSLEAIAGGVEAAAAVAAWAAFARFLRPHVGGDPARARVAALALLPVLWLTLGSPWRYNDVLFLWDTPSVAAFALGLALLQERRWGSYYVLFVVATFNRETTCFLTIAYVLASLGRVPLQTLALHAGAQLALWIGVKAALSAVVVGAAPPTYVGEGQFILTYARSLVVLTAVPGWVYLGLAFGGAWLVPLGLRQRLRGVAFAPYFRVVPVFLYGMALVGELVEVRIYSELAPLVVAGLVVGLWRVAREAAGETGRGVDAPEAAKAGAAPVVASGDGAKGAPALSPFPA